MAGTTGLEPAASCVTGKRSNQLNYAPAEEQARRCAPECGEQTIAQVCGVFKRWRGIIQYEEREGRGEWMGRG